HGPLLTLAGSLGPTVIVDGGDATLANGTNTSFFYVSSTLSPQFTLRGTAISSVTSANYIVNWQGSGTNAVLTIDSPSHVSGRFSVTNASCVSFSNCYINDEQAGSKIIGGTFTFPRNVNITGNLTKPLGAFKIDDPIDPANKYLYHSFVESPDMMNIYNGNITTDTHGLAIVVLPKYFGALNRDFRYQLTPIGQFAQVIVADEIRNNRFTIRSNKPLVRVSWQVTGIRHDAYANAHRIPNEEMKPPEGQGHYLYPELFEKSKEDARDDTRLSSGSIWK